MPEVSYVMVLTHDADRAATALRSIAAQTVDHEVLLLLHEVNDEMRALAQATASGRVIHDGVDLGLPLAWNLGLLAATAPHVAIMHEDIEMLPGCARRLLATLAERPDAAAVGPDVVSFDDEPQVAGFMIWSDAATTRRAPLDENVTPADYVASCCLFLDRQAAIDAGGFDERFFPSVYIDATIACALWASGRTVLVDRRARTRHHSGAAFDPARGARRSPRIRQFMFERNRALFADVFAELLAQQPDRADRNDSRFPTADEVAASLARTYEREADVLAGRVIPPPVSPLVVPDAPETRATARRRQFEDDFLAHLIDREQTLMAELERVGKAYEELRSGVQHLENAWTEQTAELERVHRAYADLWEDRERLRALTTEADPMPS